MRANSKRFSEYVAAVIAALALLMPALGLAQTIGGTGSPSITASSNVTASVPVAVYDGYPALGAPTTIAVSTVSASTTVTGGAAYWFDCNSAVFFRLTTGASTATVTDIPFFGPAHMKLLVPAAGNTLSVIMASGAGSCTLTLLSMSP